MSYRDPQSDSMSLSEKYEAGRYESDRQTDGPAGSGPDPTSQDEWDNRYVGHKNERGGGRADTRLKARTQRVQRSKRAIYWEKKVHTKVQLRSFFQIFIILRLTDVVNLTSLTSVTGPHGHAV